MHLELRLFKILEKVPEELREPLAEFFQLLEREIGERLTKKDFEAFERRFEAFAERTEENFRRVWEAIDKLAEAQRRTDERLDRLEKVVAELAEAQRKTEERLTTLEEKMAELAEAQRKTEEVLKGTLKRLDQLEERVEGLSDTVGYTLENRAYKALPALLAEHGLKAEGRFVRRYIKIRGKERQVNIYGYALNILLDTFLCEDKCQHFL